MQVLLLGCCQATAGSRRAGSEELAGDAAPGSGPCVLLHAGKEAYKQTSGSSCCARCVVAVSANSIWLAPARLFSTFKKPGGPFWGV